MGGTREVTAGLLLEHDIDRLMARFVQPDGPGAVIGILRDGVFILRKAYGLADLEWRTPLDPDWVFRICSLTKQFVLAVATMRLVEAGVLDLDAPVERYLPDWPARGRRVTVRHLLNHTSGVWRHDSDQLERTLRPNPPVEAVLAMIAARDFEYEPGERYQYNNSGYLLLGAIIAAVSGESYEDHLRETIFEPLGMAHTGILRHGAVTPKRARGYIKGRSGFRNARLDAMNWSHAAGALGSTVDDLARWDRAIRGNRLIRPDTLETMLEDAPQRDGGPSPYGFGWGTATWRGSRLYHHTGGISGFGCHMLHLRDEDLTTIVLANLYLFPFDPMTRGLVRVAKGWAEPAPEMRDPTGDELAACAGRYDSRDGPLVIAASAGHLASLGPGRLCERADPEVEYCFSEPDAGCFQRLDYVSPAVARLDVPPSLLTPLRNVAHLHPCLTRFSFPLPPNSASGFPTCQSPRRPELRRTPASFRYARRWP